MVQVKTKFWETHRIIKLKRLNKFNVIDKETSENTFLKSLSWSINLHVKDGCDG